MTLLEGVKYTDYNKKKKNSKHICCNYIVNIILPIKILKLT